MPENESRLTVYFDPPFWVGVYERVGDGRLEAAKITFGAEPKDYQVYEFMLKHWSRLVFSPPVNVSGGTARPQNPKRVQRAIKAQLSQRGTSTKSQQALQLQREARKAEGQERSRQQKEEKAARRFALRQQKRKEKHRGR